MSICGSGLGNAPQNSIAVFLSTYYFTLPIESYCDSVLGTCVANDDWESVLDVLDIMKRHSYTQERSTYRTCLQACLEAGNGASARDILQAMEKAFVQPEPWDIGSTVAAMCRQGSWDTTSAPSTWWRKALALLKSSATNPEIVTNSSNVIPVQAYNVLLECMVEEKQWKEAVRLLRLMEDSVTTTSKTSTNLEQSNHPQRPEGGFHPPPEVSTYREVIECCVATNQAEQAAQVLYSMKDRGVKASWKNGGAAMYRSRHPSFWLNGNFVGFVVLCYFSTTAKYLCFRIGDFLPL